MAGLFIIGNYQIKRKKLPHVIAIPLCPYPIIMKIEERIAKRSEGKCELCQTASKLHLYEVEPVDSRYADNCIMICDTCLAQIGKKAELDSEYWRFLGETMWSEVPGIQVVSWRMLNRLRNESWAMDNLDMMYLAKKTWNGPKKQGTMKMMVLLTCTRIATDISCFRAIRLF